MSEAPRLKTKYNEEILAALESEFKHTNRHNVAGLEKIVVNMGVGEAARDSKVLEGAIADITVITGQKPQVTRAKKSIAQFKLREGQAIGCHVTLRGDRMWEFLDRLLATALPRIRDFRGLSPKQFDGHGNYTSTFSVELHAPIQHPNGAGYNVKSLFLDFKATSPGDNGGTMVTSNAVSVAIVDDAPSVLERNLDVVESVVQGEDVYLVLDISGSITNADLTKGIQALQAQGLQDIKFNCVPIQGVNEAEIPALAGLAQDQAVRVRFIELMPIGCAYEVGYRGVAMAAVRHQLEQAYGPLRQVGLPAGVPRGPAVYYRLPGFAGQVGFIDAMEHKFCGSCNRVRLTAEGFLKLCLNAKTGIDLRALLRRGITEENLQLAVRQAIYHKPAEHRFEDKHNEARDARAMYQVGG